jgi:hypothetical protein
MPNTVPVPVDGPPRTENVSDGTISNPPVGNAYVRTIRKILG